MRNFFVEQRGLVERKKKGAKKKEATGLWKAKTAFHSSHEAQQPVPLFF
jgi:hypothetical protein